MKTNVIIALGIAALVIAIAVTAGVAIPLSGPIGIVDPADLASQSNDDALQKELQQEVTEDYEAYKARLLWLLREEKTDLSINDFCSELYFSEPEWDRYTQSYHVMLYSKTGFYIGPVVFLDNQGNEVNKMTLAALTPTLGTRYSTEYLNYTIVTLDEINPKFKNFGHFDIK